MGNPQYAALSNSTGNCIGLEPDGDHVIVSHSKTPGVELRVTREELYCFFDGVRGGEFDPLIDGVVVERTA